MSFGSRRRFLTGVLAGLFGVSARARSAAQEPPQREFAISARKYGFSPARIEVLQDDLVRITLTSQDIPHSFTIDKYRISKRVGAGQTVVFEFRADQAGRFAIYCNLTADPGCRDMTGELVVNGRS